MQNQFSATFVSTHVILSNTNMFFYIPVKDENCSFILIKQPLNDWNCLSFVILFQKTMEDVRQSFPIIEGMDSTSHPAMADNSTLETDTQNMFMQKAETYMAFRVAAYITNY